MRRATLSSSLALSVSFLLGLGRQLETSPPGRARRRRRACAVGRRGGRRETSPPREARREARRLAGYVVPLSLSVCLSVYLLLGSGETPRPAAGVAGALRVCTQPTTDLTGRNRRSRCRVELPRRPSFVSRRLRFPCRRRPPQLGLRRRHHHRRRGRLRGRRRVRRGCVVFVGDNGGADGVAARATERAAAGFCWWRCGRMARPPPPHLAPPPPHLAPPRPPRRRPPPPTPPSAGAGAAPPPAHRPSPRRRPCALPCKRERRERGERKSMTGGTHIF